MAKVFGGVKNFRVTHAEYDGNNVVINVVYDITYIMEKTCGSTELITFSDTFVGFRLSESDVDRLIEAIEKTGKIKKIK